MLQEKCMKRTHRFCLEVIRLVEKLKHSTSSHSYFITPCGECDVHWWQQLFCLQKERPHWSPLALRYSAIAVMNLGHFSSRLPQGNCPQQGHLVITTWSCSYLHVATTATGTVHTPSITDAAKGTILIGQDHIIDPSMTEAPVTTWRHTSLLQYPITW